MTQNLSLPLFSTVAFFCYNRPDHTRRTLEALKANELAQVVNEYGRVIVVEDDILTCPYFLRYVNDALELYKDYDKVGAVSGYLPPRYAHAYKNMPQSFFIEISLIWGWGT